MILGRIVVPIQEDFDYLQNYVSKYPVHIAQEFPDNYDIPTKIVGWKNIKSKWPKQNIMDKDISENISWIYSVGEDEKGFQEGIQKFVDMCIKKWLPSNFELLDSLENPDKVAATFKKIIDSSEKVYLNFHKGALYAYHQGDNYIFNIKSLYLYYKDYRDVLTRFIQKSNAVCLSSENIVKYVYLDSLEYVHTFENAHWVKNGKELSGRYFKIIPELDMGKYIPFIMSTLDKFEFNETEQKALRRAFVRDSVTQWLSDRTICFRDGFVREGLDFVYKGQKKFAKIKFSNKRTVTGRITTVSSYNPQSLDKKTEARKDIVSRFKGGKIVVYDYTSFESRIALYLCEDPNFIQEYQFKDLHHEIAKMIFGGNVVITDSDREFAKILNHSILYRASSKSILKKLEDTGNAQNIYDSILNFLAPILEKAGEIDEFFKTNNYIINAYGSIIWPNKDYVGFNNFIQSTATEILIEKIIELRKFLNSYKSELLFQVHDSIVFDIHPDESVIINEVAKILMKIDSMIFTLDYKSGYNYKELSSPIKIISY